MGRVVYIKSEGNWNKTKDFLNHVKNVTSGVEKVMRRYAELGLQSLRAATPKDTGKTAASWDYVITYEGGNIRLDYVNNNVVNGWANIAILLEYGHGTRNGGYVSARNYITPAIKPIFDTIAESAWKEVLSIGR